MSKNLSRCEFNLQIDVTLQNITAQATLLDSLQSGVSSGDAAFAKLTASLANGTGSGQATKIFHKRITFANGDNDLDLNAGTDTPDKWGAAQVFAKVKLFVLRIVTPATAVYLLVKPTASNGWKALHNAGSTDSIKCGDTVYFKDLIDGFAISGTSKVLRINNPGTALAADLILIGT